VALLHFPHFATVHQTGSTPQGTVAAIPFPSTLPLSEQQTIVAKLDAIQEQIDGLNGLAVDTEKQIDALIPSILDRTFNGEL
jgi:type I restriction enzyme S subunit